MQSLRPLQPTELESAFLRDSQVIPVYMPVWGALAEECLELGN